MPIVSSSSGSDQDQPKPVQKSSSAINQNTSQMCMLEQQLEMRAETLNAISKLSPTKIDATDDQLSDVQQEEKSRADEKVTKQRRVMKSLIMSHR